MQDVFTKLYSNKVMKHVQNPQNLGVIKNADGIGTVGNPVCGDIMRIYIKIAKRGNIEYLKDVKFQTLGCGAAIATSSMITTMIKGKKLKDALKISKDEIAKALDGLPVNKLHCSVLATHALKKAVKDYKSK